MDIKTNGAQAASGLTPVSAQGFWPDKDRCGPALRPDRWPCPQPCDKGRSCAPDWPRCRPSRPCPDTCPEPCAPRCPPRREPCRDSCRPCPPEPCVRRPQCALTQCLVDTARVRVCDQLVTLYPQCVRPGMPPAPPLRLLSATVCKRQPEARDIQCEPACERPGLTRVSAEVVIPVEVCFCDADGRRFTGDEVLIVPVCALLRLPRNSHYTFGAMARARVSPASCHAESRFALRACFDADVCLYVATIERCERSDDCCESSCDWYFSLPLYPPG